MGLVEAGELCEECGSSYNKRVVQQRFCSEACRKRAEQRRYRDRYRVTLGSCVVCGGATRLLGARGPSPRYCTEHAQSVGKVRPSRSEVRCACIWCGKEFVAGLRGPVGRFCSAGCRSKASPSRRRSIEEAAERRSARHCEWCCGPLLPRRKTYCSDPCRRNALKGRPRSVGSCSDCGVLVGGPQRVVLCTGCRRRHTRASDNGKTHVRRLRPGAAYESFSHEDIFERDGWRCHICQHRVSRKTATIDHLVPLSCGGDHTAINVATAHRRCNIKRSNKGSAQLRLVG